MRFMQPETVVVREPTYVYHTDTSSNSSSSAQNQLEELKSLFEQGLITEKEYANKRQEILDSM